MKGENREGDGWLGGHNLWTGERSASIETKPLPLQQLHNPPTDYKKDDDKHHRLLKDKEKETRENERIEIWYNLKPIRKEKSPRASSE